MNQETYQLLLMNGLGEAEVVLVPRGSQASVYDLIIDKARQLGCDDANLDQMVLPRGSLSPINVSQSADQFWQSINQSYRPYMRKNEEQNRELATIDLTLRCGRGGHFYNGNVASPAYHIDIENEAGQRSTVKVPENDSRQLGELIRTAARQLGCTEPDLQGRLIYDRQTRRTADVTMPANEFWGIMRDMRFLGTVFNYQERRLIPTIVLYLFCPEMVSDPDDDPEMSTDTEDDSDDPYRCMAFPGSFKSFI